MEGAAGATLEERYEEARHGCPHECQRLAATADDTVSETEANFVIGQLEEMSDAIAVGERLLPESYEVWQWALFTYWTRLEKDFQRNIWIKIGFAAEAGFGRGLL